MQFAVWKEWGIIELYQNIFIIQQNGYHFALTFLNEMKMERW